MALQWASQYYGCPPSRLCQRLGRSSAHDMVLDALSHTDLCECLFAAKRVRMGTVLYTQRTWTGLVVCICNFHLLFVWKLVCFPLLFRVKADGIMERLWEYLCPARLSLRVELSRTSQSITSFVRACMYQWIVHARVLGALGDTVLRPDNSMMDAIRQWEGLTVHTAFALR